MKIISVEGSSTAYGSFDEQGGWAARLHLDALRHNAATSDPHAHHVAIHNHAFSGNTLSGILKGYVAHQLPESQRPAATILSVGINEAKIFKGAKRPIVSDTLFTKQLAEFSKRNAELAIPTIFIGPQPINDSDEALVGRTPDCVLEDDMIEYYGSLIQAEAERNSAPYINTRKVFDGYSLDKILDTDGYHPNTFGHELLHDAVRQTLNEMGIAPHL